MKIQDAVFIVVLMIILAIKRPRVSVVVGLACFGLSIPLFATWTFFTAERLTYYAGAFILLAVLQMFFSIHRK